MRPLREGRRRHHSACGAGRRAALRSRSARRDVDEQAGDRRHARPASAAISASSCRSPTAATASARPASSAPRRRRSGRCRSTAATRSRSSERCSSGIRPPSACGSRRCSACRRACGSICSSTTSRIARTPIASSCCSRATSSATSSTSATWRARSCTRIDHFDAMKGQIYNVGLSDANLSKLELCQRIQKHLPAFVDSRVERRQGSRQARLHRVEREDRAHGLQAGVLAGRRHSRADQGLRDDPQHEVLEHLSMTRPRPASHLRRVVVPERGREHPDAGRAARQDVRRRRTSTTSCSSSTMPRPTRRSSLLRRGTPAQPTHQDREHVAPVRRGRGCASPAWRRRAATPSSTWTPTCRIRRK